MRRSFQSPSNWLINLAFVFSLLVLVVPDAIVYRSSGSRWLDALAIGGTLADVGLFLIVFVCLRLDIQRRRRVEQTLAERNRELDESNRALSEAAHTKSEFLRIAAHDLRNPLNTVHLLAGSLEECADPADLRESRQAIERSVQEMLGLIEDLLEIAALESGTVQIAHEPVDLGEVARAVAADRAPLAQRKHQRIELHIANDCEVLGDAQRLREAVGNLLGNAIKFSPPTGEIALSVERAGGQIRCVVADHGPGLSARDKELLFQQFQRLSARPTGGETSTGLGLSIVRKLVELHGGRVFAESDGPGLGSRFIVEVAARPLVPA